MNEEISDHLHILNDNIVRIAKALEEVIRLVKEDQEKFTAKESRERLQKDE